MNKKFLVLFCLILFIVSVSAVSAADDVNQTLNPSQSDGEIISDEIGTFSELQEKIIYAENESTIVLEKDYVYDGDEGGEGINITKNITINGNGHTIDGNHATRIFNVDANNVVLNNITFINGKTQSGGGAIYGVFDDEEVYIGPKNIEINSCSFIDCVADGFGGAIRFEDNLIVNNCTFNNNKAGCGGAIMFFDGSASIENSQFLNNSLLSDGESSWVKGGGAIFFGGCEINVENSTFLDNKATNEGECGGAILCFESVTGSFDNSIFLNNSATSGSTFYFVVYSELTISNSTIDNPFVDNQIYVDGGSSGSTAEFINVSYDDFKNQSFFVWEGIFAYKTIIKVDNLEKTFGEDKRLYINLTDINSNPLRNKEISIELNGVTYTRKTNDNGQASMAINLGVGQYEAIISFEGEDIVYFSSENVSNITINPSIFCESYMHKYCKGPEPFTAQFLDTQGNPLTSGEATFNINGVLYKRNINQDGYAKLNINLDQGVYIITATNPVTGEMASAKIEISPTITDNHDLVKYYRNDSQYIVRLLGSDGNPVGAGEVVTFNINGVFYNRVTDENGYAKLNINLQPDDYIITAEYNGCRVSNNISVLPVLQANDLEMAYRDGSTFNVTLLDGQGNPYAGQNVTFNINGIFYTRITGENGVAKLNINLQAGEYLITSSYDESNIVNRVKVI